MIFAWKKLGLTPYIVLKNTLPSFCTRKGASFAGGTRRILIIRCTIASFQTTFGVVG